MTATLMTLYFLIWPVVSAAILILLVVSLVRDLRRARKDGQEMI